MPTAQHLLDYAFRRATVMPAIVDGTRRYSYGDLWRRSTRLISVLVHGGAGPDRPIATLMPNCAEFIEIDVAATLSGVTRVGLNERLSDDECLYILEQSRAAVLVTTADRLERLWPVPDEVRLVLVIGDGQPRGDGRRLRLLSYDDAIEGARPSLHPAAVAGGDPNYILYTSGTTGRPKGASHTHGSRAASTLNMLAAELRAMTKPVMMHAGPVTHGSGSKIIAILCAGGTNVILPHFDPESLADAVAQESGSHTFIVPTMLHRILDSTPAVRQKISGLTQISFGGSPIAPSLFARAIDEFGDRLTQVYGSAEAPHPVSVLGPDVYADRQDDQVLATAGRIAYGVEVKIVNDTEAEAAPGEAGEIWIRGSGLMSGYWRNDEATKAAFAQGDWYRSGDVGLLTEDGLLCLVDRKRDLIISGGMNIYPNEVERVLSEHAGVSQVAVVGYPDEEWGESVAAFIVLEKSSAVSEAELMDWCKERLASYKKPKLLQFVSSLPIGSTGKVLKRELKERFWTGRERNIN
jgi:acyl-CoA synthetase (AMP-forming)/AMP-acid ligase II